jgi:quercetin dioxygenase-like cupin family protein
VSAPFLKFDLDEALGELKSEEAWRTRPRNAVTLLNDEGMRVVLVGLHADASIESHRAEGPISIQVVAGALHVTAGGESLALGPGQVVTMQAGVEHDVHAAEESAFLLTIGG